MRPNILENALALLLKAPGSTVGILSSSVELYRNPDSGTQGEEYRVGQEKDRCNRVIKGYDKQCPNFHSLFIYISVTLHARHCAK